MKKFKNNSKDIFKDLKNKVEILKKELESPLMVSVSEDENVEEVVKKELDKLVEDIFKK